MKNTLKIIFASFLCFQSCNSSDCDEICTTPPTPFQFELTDKTTGENLFTNETYDPAQIEVINLNGTETINFHFINENNLNLIEFNSIGWETGITHLSLSVDSENIFELYVDAERVENCCSFTRYNEVRIDNAEYQTDPNTGVTKILVE